MKMKDESNIEWESGYYSCAMKKKANRLQTDIWNSFETQESTDEVT